MISTSSRPITRGIELDLLHSATPGGCWNPSERRGCSNDTGYVYRTVLCRGENTVVIGEASDIERVRTDQALEYKDSYKVVTRSTATGGGCIFPAARFCRRMCCPTASSLGGVQARAHRPAESAPRPTTSRRVGKPPPLVISLAVGAFTPSAPPDLRMF